MKKALSIEVQMLGVKDHRCEWCSVSAPIWQIVNLPQTYPWSVGQRSRQRLARLIPPNEFAAIFAVPGGALINRNLRVKLAPRLSGQNRELAAALALWIITEWGGIRRGKEAIVTWSSSLADYNDLSVSKFVESQGNHRISSWSKLLAFANYAHHAIYDARTAVALNCALAHIKDSRRFHMPTSRNKLVSDAQKLTLQEENFEARGYRHYLELLKCFVAETGQVDLLSAEMILFANAPNLAKGFVTQMHAP